MWRIPRCARPNARRGPSAGLGEGAGAGGARPADVSKMGDARVTDGSAGSHQELLLGPGDAPAGTDRRLDRLQLAHSPGGCHRSVERAELGHAAPRVPAAGLHMQYGRCCCCMCCVEAPIHQFFERGQDIADLPRAVWQHPTLIQSSTVTYRYPPCAELVVALCCHPDATSSSRWTA